MSPEAIDPSVLVVDDQREVADSYTIQLEGRFSVETAYSGEEALELVSADTDVVLLDRRMPGLSGDKVLTKIRGRDLSCRVIMVTAVNPQLDILDMPFDDYLCKPVDREDLHSAVDQQLRIIAYDVFREYFELTSKREVLQTQLTTETLQASSDYTSTEARLVQLERRLRGLTDEFEEIADTFADINRESSA